MVLKAAASATEAECRRIARDHLAHFKVPKSFRVVDDLPRTATGKIQKYIRRSGRTAISRL